MAMHTRDGRLVGLDDFVDNPERTNVNPRALTPRMRVAMMAAYRAGGKLSRGSVMSTAQARGIVNAGYATAEKSFWRNSRGDIKGGIVSITLNAAGMKHAALLIERTA